MLHLLFERLTGGEGDGNASVGPRRRNSARPSDGIGETLHFAFERCDIVEDHGTTVADDREALLLERMQP